MLAEFKDVVKIYGEGEGKLYPVNGRKKQSGNCG